jgi:hypothetical protein
MAPSGKLGPPAKSGDIPGGNIVQPQSMAQTCGIRSAASSQAGTAAAVEEIAAALGRGLFQHIIVMYSPAHNAKLIGELFRHAFPDAEISGCSTSGEITPLGMMQGGIVALAFPKHGFRVETDVIADVDRSGVEHASQLARKLKSRFSWSTACPTPRKYSSLPFTGPWTTCSSLAARPATTLHFAKHH